jgi:hypothetical protein
MPYRRMEMDVTNQELMAWLNALGLSPRQGAEALGVVPRQMYRYLNGEHPIPTPVARLAQLLAKQQERIGK